LHHEEIIVKREEVAMLLTSLCEHPGKEQQEWGSRCPLSMLVQCEGRTSRGC